MTANNSTSNAMNTSTTTTTTNIIHNELHGDDAKSLHSDSSLSDFTSGETSSRSRHAHEDHKTPVSEQIQKSNCRKKQQNNRTNLSIICRIMRQPYGTTEPSVYAEVDSVWTSSKAHLQLVPRLPTKNIADLMIHLRVVPALKFRLLQLLHWPENCHRFRPTVKCRQRLPTVPEVLLRQIPIRFPVTTVADSACVWVAKRKRWRRLDLRITSQPKSVKVRAAICHLNRSKWWHLLRNPLMLPVPARAVATRPYHPKKPNSRTGNAERTTIR